MTRLPADSRPGPTRAAPGGQEQAACWTVATVGPGAAGATTLALAVATTAQALLVEADADGGVLGLRLGAWLHQGAPSVATLLAALGPDAKADVYAHTQRLPTGVRAVLLPAVAEDAAGPVAHLTAALPVLRQLLQGGRLVLDAGRLRPGSSATRLAAGSDVCVLVAAASVEGLGCLLQRLPALAAQLPRLVVAVRGEGPYRPGDIREEVVHAAGRPTPVVFVRHDPRGVAALAEVHDGRRDRNRSRTAVLHAAADLVEAAVQVQGRHRDRAGSPLIAGPVVAGRRVYSLGAEASGSGLENTSAVLDHPERELSVDPRQEASRPAGLRQVPRATGTGPAGGPW